MSIAEKMVQVMEGDTGMVQGDLNDHSSGVEQGVRSHLATMNMNYYSRPIGMSLKSETVADMA